MSKTKKQEVELTEDGEAVGTRNDERLAKLNAISQGVEESLKDEFETPPEDSDDAPVHEIDPSPEAPPQEESLAAPPPEPEDPLAKIGDVAVTQKVNGKMITKSVKDWLATGSKVEAADAYLAHAAQFVRKQQEEPAPAPEVDDDLAIARAIQMGSEEEAVKALKQFRQKVTPAPPGISPDELPRIVDERLNFLDAASKFREEFPEILNDPILSEIALKRDAEMMQAGDARPYIERYREIGTNLRNWKASLVPQSSSDKQQRKASVTTIPTAHARAGGADIDQDESASDVIANMAKARGQAI